MNRKALTLTALLPLLAGCMDFTGLGDAIGEALAEGMGGGMGGGPWVLPGSRVEGPAFIGEEPTMSGEATALFYLPSDTVAEVASAPVEDGRYALWLPQGEVDVCQYLVRLERWDGMRSEIVPLFDTPPSPCEPDPVWPSGVALELPAYEPLAEPFVVKGRIWVDGRPAAENEAAVTVIHREIDGVTETTVHVYGDGRYRLETRDGALRFGLCQWMEAGFASGTRVDRAFLGPVPMDECATGRTLPEIHFGSVRAAWGSVEVETGWPDYMVSPVGAGEAVVELLAPADSSVVGDAAPTLDDGTFHLWFPFELRSPGCDWLVRVTLGGGRSQIQPLLQPGMVCEPAQYVPFLFAAVDDTPPPVSGVLELSIVDPRGDHTGLTDVTAMTMEVDTVSGDWLITIEADPAAPFQDSLRVNVNLYNTTANSFFATTMNDMRPGEPTTILELRGTAPELTSWREGDTVYTNSLAGTPNPPGATLYRSSVGHFPMGYLTNEDVIAFEDLAQPAVLRRR